MMKYILFMVLVMQTIAAQAEENTELSVKKLEPKIIYKKKTSIDFQDAVIEGRGDNPEGLYLVSPPEKKFGGLLKLRPNFHRELMRDALLLK